MAAVSSLAHVTYNQSVNMNKSDSNNNVNNSNHNLQSEDISFKKTHRLDTLISDIAQDSKLAKTMAEAAAFIPDQLLFDLNEFVPLNNIAARTAWGKKSADFDMQAINVTHKRIDIYNEMKNTGSSDFQIFKAIMHFNKTLPNDYQIKAGLLKIGSKF